jgi:hypothetical protein
MRTSSPDRPVTSRRESVRTVVLTPLPEPRKAAKSCVPTSATAARRIAPRSSGSRIAQWVRRRSGERAEPFQIA